MRGNRWSLVGLALVLVFDVAWRCHTIAPPVEPLDCDEAIYAYIGKQLDHGAVMYRDLTENKPPLGYWLYALAVKLGGANERTVRLMPIPFVLATIGLLWWLGRRLQGPVSAVLAGLIYAVLSTDPFVYGNGDQMELMINLFATAALACLVAALGRPEPGRGWLIASGACVGAAALVKQVAAINGLLFALILIRGRATRPRQWLGDQAALLAGCVVVCGIAALTLIAQGAGRDAFEDIFRYGPALATDVPPPPNAPPWWVRWWTGNADPDGHLPWPFGQTGYLVWWGTGIWPALLATVPALGWLLTRREPARGDLRRLLAFWTLSAWVQVALPRLFWAHYYLLLMPGLALTLAVVLGDLTDRARQGQGRGRAAIGALALSLALVWTGAIQIKEYAQVAPDELTIRHKGGRQWVTLRALGRELGRRSRVWPEPRLFVWGWQSPLYFYSGLDGVTRQVFTDDLIKSFATTSHPRVRPRIERTMHDLRTRPPALIFCGYPPFAELRAWLATAYLPSNLTAQSADGRGLWVERTHYGAFEAFPPTSPVRTNPPAPAGPRR